MAVQEDPVNPMLRSAQPLVRVIEVRDGGLDALAAHARPLVEQGRSVLIVSGAHTARVLLAHLAKAGVDTRRIFVVDAAGGAGTLDPQGDPEHQTVIPNPTLLELIALRARQAIRTKAEGPPHVIVHTVNAFAAYNPTPVLQELVHYVVEHVARPPTTIDFVVESSTQVDPILLADLRHLTSTAHPAGKPPPAAAGAA